jgi:hypothetical protein
MPKTVCKYAKDGVYVAKDEYGKYAKEAAFVRESNYDPLVTKAIGCIHGKMQQ